MFQAMQLEDSEAKSYKMCELEQFSIHSEASGLFFSGLW